MARKLKALLFHSLDGVVSNPTWQFDSFDDELAALMTAALAEIDEAILGRVSYDEWAGYWPSAMVPESDRGFAEFINRIPKHIASRTRSKADLAWENSHLVEGDLLDYVQALKQTEGGTIAVEGSISVVQQLLQAGVLDELTLITHPVVAGQGRHLFTAEWPVTRLELVNSYPTTKGNVVSSYRVRQG